MDNPNTMPPTINDMLLLNETAYLSPKFIKEAKKHSEIVRQYLPQRSFVPYIIDILKEYNHHLELNDKQLYNRIRNTFKEGARCYDFVIVLAGMQFILNESLPIMNLEEFPDYFIQDYLSRRQQAPKHNINIKASFNQKHGQL